MNFYLIVRPFIEPTLASLLVEELRELREYLWLCELLYELHTGIPIPDFIEITRELLESTLSDDYLNDGADY